MLHPHRIQDPDPASSFRLPGLVLPLASMTGAEDSPARNVPIPAPPRP